MSQRVEADNVPNQYQMDIYALVKDPQSIVIKREQEAQNNRSKSELSQSEDSQAREIGRSDRAVNAMVLPQERPVYYQKKSKFASKYWSNQVSKIIINIAIFEFQKYYKMTVTNQKYY